jgi:hypothetical protein
MIVLAPAKNVQVFVDMRNEPNTLVYSTDESLQEYKVGAKGGVWRLQVEAAAC